LGTSQSKVGCRPNNNMTRCESQILLVTLLVFPTQVWVNQFWYILTHFPDISRRSGRLGSSAGATANPLHKGLKIPMSYAWPWTTRIANCDLLQKPEVEVPEKTECICKFLGGILSVCHVLKKHAATRYVSSAMKSETYLNVDRHGLKRYKVILVLNCRRLQTIHFSSELYKVIQCYALLRIRTCRVLFLCFWHVTPWCFPLEFMPWGFCGARARTLRKPLSFCIWASADVCPSLIPKLGKLNKEVNYCSTGCERVDDIPSGYLT